MIPTPTAPVDVVSMLATVILPFLLAVIIQPSWSDKKRRIVVLVVSGLFGLLSAFVSGALMGWPAGAVEFTNWLLAKMLLVIGLSQGFYTLGKPFLKKVEEKTSPKAVTVGATAAHRPESQDRPE